MSPEEVVQHVTQISQNKGFARGLDRPNTLDRVNKMVATRDFYACMGTPLPTDRAAQIEVLKQAANRNWTTKKPIVVDTESCIYFVGTYDQMRTISLLGYAMDFQRMRCYVLDEKNGYKHDLRCYYRIGAEN